MTTATKPQTSKKSSPAKAEKPKAVPRPTVKGKSRKAIVCEAWKKDPEASVEALAKISHGVKESTIRSWRVMWNQGWGFPVGYGPTTKPEEPAKGKKSAKKSK